MIRSATKIAIPLLIFTALACPAMAARPQVSVKSISPVKGPPGTVLKITGQNFATDIDDNRIFIGKKQLKITSVFPNSITAVIPNGAKSGIITVQTRKNGSTKASKAFTVLAPLKITGVSKGVALAGEVVVITGSGFDRNRKNNKVFVSGKKCKVVRVGPKELAFEVSQKAKTGKIRIEVPGQPAIETSKTFIVAEQPKITKFTPSSGHTGDTVTIKGAKFGKDIDALEVRIGAGPCRVLSVSDSKITVEVTKQSRSGAVQLAVNGIKSNPSRSAFTILQPLKATKMDPLTVSPGDEVRIFGTGFSSRAKDHTLTIGKKQVKAHEVTTAYVAFRVPKNIEGGKNKVRLDVSKLGTINIPVPLTVVQRIQIDNISPQSGSAGSTVTIRGNHFGESPGDVRVFLGRQYAKVLSVNNSEIQAVIPNGVSSSRITVQTRHNGTDVSKETFKVETMISATSFAPTSGGPNQKVRIFGQGFSSNPKHNVVKLGKVNVPVLQAANNNLLVQIPSKASTHQFRISVDGGSPVETSQSFQVLKGASSSSSSSSSLSISQISPATGTVGTYVRLTGMGFTNGMTAFVGRAPAGIRVISPTQAMIAIPPKATGGPITLMIGRNIHATSKQTFQLVASVSVNKFYPQSGRPGTDVTIYGNEFVPGKTQVFLGKTQLKVGPGANDTMLRVTIPDTSDSGPFRIKVAGRKEVRSVGAFKVLPPVVAFKPQDKPKASSSVLESKPDDTPVIEKLLKEKPKEALPAKKKTPEKAPTIDELLGFESDGEKLELKSFEPQSGPIGETITINGTGFGDDPAKVRAWVGAKAANVLGCVPDMIMIEVPEGAGNGKIKLRIGGKPPLTSKKEFKTK